MKIRSVEEYGITPADDSYFEGIVELFTSPEELFLICPSGTWPFSRKQLERPCKE